MIAEHGLRALAQGFHEAQGLQRFGASINQVSAKPKGIDSGVEVDFFEQSAELGVTTLDVPYRVDCHRCKRLVQYPRGRQHELIDFGIKMRSIVGQHLVTALHRTYRGFEHGARGVNKLFPWL